MSVIQLTQDNFETEALHSDIPVLIDFYADWCGPCKMVAPIVQELSEERTDCKVCKLNVDEAPDLAARYNVLSIPTLIVLKEGKVARQVVGARGKEAIKAMLD